MSGSSSLSELSSSFAILFVAVCLDRLATCIFSFSSSVSVSLSSSGVFTLSGAVASLGMFSFLAKCCLNQCFCWLDFFRFASAILFCVVAIHFFLSASFL